MSSTASKFRNASPKIPKKEFSFSDLPIKSTDVTFGYPIVCNRENVIFSLGDGSVGVIPLKDVGRKQFSVPQIKASSNSLISIAATSLDSRIFATACDVEGIKIWKNKTDCFISYSSHFMKCPSKTKLKSILFHPCTSEILAFTSNTGVSVFNLVKGQVEYEYCQLVNAVSCSWKGDGSMLISTNDSGEFHIYDPREAKDAVKFNQGLKNVKVVWGGDTDHVMAFGSNKSTSTRSVYAWDVRNCSKIWSKQDFDTSTGFLLPVYDSDTKMIVVGSKGGATSYFLELESSGLSNPRVDKYDEPSQGLYLVPRTELNVMECEVMRVYQLCKSVINPISYHVIRKSYTSYYPELFPFSCENKQSITADEWFSGKNKELNRITLQPSLMLETSSQDVSNVKKEENQKTEEPEAFKIHSFSTDSESYSKYKNIKGNKLHKNFQHEMLSNVEGKSSSECNGMAVYSDTIAIPLLGHSGKIGILKLSKPGRSADSGVLYMENKSPICDFDIDKKDDSLLACVCDDTSINVWKIPPGGLETNRMTSDERIKGNTERSTILKFHPCAKSIISTASVNGTIRVWDINKKSNIVTCKTNDRSQILSMEWNQQGSMICTISSDKKICILDPRNSTSSNITSDGFQGTGPGRMIFLDEHMLFVSGFIPQGNRIIGLRDTRKINEIVASLELNNAPSVLIPFYDPDNKLIYLGAKGESSITPFEFRNDSNSLIEMPRYQSFQSHSAICMLHKNMCSVKDVEIAKFVRLMKSSTEIVSFVVPRLKNQYFQDDLYRPTLKVWESSMTSEDWITKKDKIQSFASLKPEGMVNLSEVDMGPVQPNKYDSRIELKAANKKHQQDNGEDFLGFVMNKAKMREEDPIMQDEREGLDDNEWDD